VGELVLKVILGLDLKYRTDWWELGGMETAAVLTRPDSHDLRLLRPGGSEYEEARTVWNAMVDHRPAAIAPCGSA
jgi:hypothetical protein